MDVLLLVFIMLVIFIIVASGLISGSEAAFLSLSYTKAREIAGNVKSKKDKLRAKRLLIIKENIQEYISSIVILNNLVNIVGSVYVGVLGAKVFGDVYLGLVSGVLTFLIIIFAEIIPKVIGEKNCETISMRIAPFWVRVYSIFKPLIWVINKIVRIFVKVDVEKQVSQGEIREMANLGKQEGSIKDYESKVISNVFRLEDTEAYEIMVPKSRVVYFELETKYEEIVEKIVETGLTRFPVLDDNDKVVGFVHSKDLFKFQNTSKKFSVSKVLRPIFVVPESMKASTLEKKFKKEKLHLAIVVDEYGDFTGIVTLEDVIEEIIGEIEDEFDPERKSKVVNIGKDKYRVMADCEISHLNERLNLHIPEDDDFSIVNGFLVDKLDKIPEVDDKVHFENLFFTVKKVDDRRAISVELEILKSEDDEDEDLK